MTEQCPLCKAERVAGEEYCLTSECPWHFENQSQSEPSYMNSEDAWEKDRKEMEKEQEPPESQSEPSYMNSEDAWEKDRKEMEKEQEPPEPSYDARVVDGSEVQGMLVFPDKKEVPFGDNPKTVGRSDVPSGSMAGHDPYEVSRQQFTIWEKDGHYFIEDRITSVQSKSSGNHTKVNGDDITEQPERELHDGDKIEFAGIPGCEATFKIR